KNVEWNGAIDLFRVKQADEIIGAGDFCAIDGKQNIAAEQTSVIGRASRFHRAHHGSKSLCEAKAQCNPTRQGNRSGAYAEIGTADPSMFDEFAEHKACRVRCNRETDALRARNNSGVDANDLAPGGDQWSA